MRVNTWVGCVLTPDNLFVDAVVGLPEGGFAITNFQTGGVASMAAVLAGKTTGNLWEWNARDG